jgi:protein ImuA
MGIGPQPPRKAQLEILRRQIVKAARLSMLVEKAAPLDIKEIDSCLGGGVALGGLHEIAAADHRSSPAALGFLLALTQTVQRVQGAILWPLVKSARAFGAPYAPGLKFFGLNPGQVVFVRCTKDRDSLWAIEEGLRLGGIASVIGARDRNMDLTASRRLQLAAEQANTPVFLLRTYNDSASSAAVTRWRVNPAPSAHDVFGFYKNARFKVALEYARGGKTGEWVMEWDHDAHSLRLSSALGDRAAGEGRAA